MAERSLVTFTLLSQAAAGTLALLACLGGLADLTGLSPTGGRDLIGLPSLIVVGGLLGTGILTSLRHLGNPRNAVLAALNWRVSWLSREIVAAGTFGVLVALTGAVTLGANVLPAVVTPSVSHTIRPPLTALAAIAGLGLVTAMTRLYAVRTVPSWGPVAIAATFTGASLLLGAPIAALLALLAGWTGPLTAAWLCLAAVAGVVLEMWSAALLRRGTGVSRAGGGLRPRPAASLPAGPDMRTLAIGVVFGGLGLAALAATAVPLAAASLVVGLLALAVAAAASRGRFYLRAPGVRR
jgi:DMSO reductase anchor subunit